MRPGGSDGGGGKKAASKQARRRCRRDLRRKARQKTEDRAEETDCNWRLDDVGEQEDEFNDSLTHSLKRLKLLFVPPWSLHY